MNINMNTRIVAWFVVYLLSLGCSRAEMHYIHIIEGLRNPVLFRAAPRLYIGALVFPVQMPGLAPAGSVANRGTEPSPNTAYNPTLAQVGPALSPASAQLQFWARANHIPATAQSLPQSSTGPNPGPSPSHKPGSELSPSPHSRLSLCHSPTHLQLRTQPSSVPVEFCPSPNLAVILVTTLDQAHERQPNLDPSPAHSPSESPSIA